jgi:hypothetical protein
MAKYIFATKFKKIEKEPLYYNIQVSVDKDFIDDAPFPQIIYADSPITLFFDSSSYIWEAKDMFFRIHKLFGVLKLVGDTMVVEICDGDYPFPEIIQVDHNGTIFTFTPIPVYETEPETKPEPLYYNMQVSVDKDFITDTNDRYNFYANVPRIFNWSPDGTTGFEYSWGNTRAGIVYHDVNNSMILYLDEVGVFTICHGEYPLPGIISVVYDGTTFTFTPIPVYE